MFIAININYSIYFCFYKKKLKTCLVKNYIYLLTNMIFRKKSPFLLFIATFLTFPITLFAQEKSTTKKKPLSLFAMPETGFFIHTGKIGQFWNTPMGFQAAFGFRDSLTNIGLTVSSYSCYNNSSAYQLNSDNYGVGLTIFRTFMPSQNLQPLLV